MDLKVLKDWGHWPLLSKELAKEGFIVIRVSFSHNGTSIDHPLDMVDLEAFGNNTFSKEASDVHTVIDWLHDCEFTSKMDLNQINLVGHSRGGAITIITANENTKVKKIATLSGVGTLQRFSQQELEGWKKAGVAYSINSRTNQKLPMYYSLAQDYLNNNSRFDLQQITPQIKQPYLIIHAELDETVIMEEAQNLYEWAPNSELKIIHGANHSFDGKHPYEENELPKSTTLAKQHLVEFFKSK